MKQTRVQVKGINENGTITDEYHTFNGQIIYSVTTDSGQLLRLPFAGMRYLKPDDEEVQEIIESNNKNIGRV